MRGLGSALAVTVENRAAVGKDFLCGAARSWAGFSRSQWPVQMGELQGIQSQALWGCQEPAWPGGVRGVFRIYFVMWFMFMKCLCQTHSRELWVRQKGNLWYSGMREERRKQWIPCGQHTFVCGITCLTSLVHHSAEESLEWGLRERETEMSLLGRREGVSGALIVRVLIFVKLTAFLCSHKSLSSWDLALQTENVPPLFH